MKKRLYLLIGIFIVSIFFINLSGAVCEGIVNCPFYDSDGADCTSYGCTWDETGICVNATEHIPDDIDCAINDHEFQCLGTIGCEWIHCYGEDVNCPAVNQADCNLIEDCQYECCSETGSCILYPEGVECPTDLGCVWDTNSRCEGGEINNEGGLTCEQLNYQWMCDYYSPTCTWFGSGCTGTFNCPNLEAQCRDRLGCSWSCLPCESYWYEDFDGDYYSDETSQFVCNRPSAIYHLSTYFTSNNGAITGDCDYANPKVNPGMPENCTNEIDDDCDGYCDTLSSTCADDSTPGDSECQGICGDGTCDEGDEDCNSCEADCGVCDIYWSLDEYTEITTPPILEISLGYQIKMVVENSGYEEGSIPFVVYENDPITDDEIRGGKSNYIQGTVDGTGKAIAEWTITEEDLETASSQAGDQESDIYDDFEFYFIAGTSIGGEYKSGNLYAQYVLGVCDQITLCKHYTETQCNPDSCDVNAASVPDDIDCELEGYNCRCEYDDIEGCQATWDGIEDNPENPEGPPITIGTCTYLTDDSIDPLGCEDDDYLSYGWEGVWTWASGNEITQYDPNDKQAQCETEGVSWVACPAQIELPFLGTWGIIVTIALIVLIYVVLNMKKHKGKKAKKK